MAYSRDQALEVHKDYQQTVNNWEYYIRSYNGGYDYMIGFYWQNNDEREAGYAAYAETDLQSQFDEIESCQIVEFEGYPIVQPSS